MIKEKLGLNNSGMRTIGGAAFAYLFHRITQRDLVHYIDDKETADRILGVLRREGELLKNCKLYAWAAFKASQFGDVKPKYKEYGIERSDALFLSRLNLKHLNRKFASLNVEDFDQLVEDVVYGNNIGQYIGKFISKCMIFLVRSYGVSREDLESDMRASAIKALYMHYPRFESLLHFENVAKSAIHNCGQSLISYHTAPSRQRLVRNALGDFEATNVEMTNLSNLEASSSYLDHLKEPLEVLTKLQTKLRPLDQRFILCCAGHHDQEFSQYLGADNSKLVDSIAYSRYMSKARKFFELSEERVNQLFGNIKMHLVA